MVETTWFSHRALWHLIFGGAFRRHPGLKPRPDRTGLRLDPRRAGHAGLLPRAAGRGRSPGRHRRVQVRRRPGARPWAGPARGLARATASWAPASCARTRSRCATASASTRSCGAATTRTTRAPTRTPARPSASPTRACRPTRSRPMLGGNAARVYGFDLARLAPIAARVGPTVGELAEPLEKIPAGRHQPGVRPGRLGAGVVRGGRSERAGNQGGRPLCSVNSDPHAPASSRRPLPCRSRRSMRRVQTAAARSSTSPPVSAPVSAHSTRPPPPTVPTCTPTARPTRQADSAPPTACPADHVAAAGAAGEASAAR